jgi:hypothetical protein
VRQLAVAHFGAERRIDNAVRTVRMRITMLGIDLLDPGASPQGGGRLQCVGVQRGRHLTPQGIHSGGAEGSDTRHRKFNCVRLLVWKGGHPPSPATRL